MLRSRAATSSGSRPIILRWKLLWAIRSDGVMLSLTYYKSQQIAGWGRHDTDGLFVSNCSVVEPPNNALYVATQRFPGTNTAYMIERMDNRQWLAAEDVWAVAFEGVCMANSVTCG